MLSVLTLALVGCSTAAGPAAPTALGPYAINELVEVGDITLELIGTVTKDPDAPSMDEVEILSSTSATLAGENRQYMVVRIRVGDTVNGSTTVLKLPPHGDPYMTADGQRIEVGDWGVESFTAEAPANRLVAEFAVPVEAKEVLVFLPLGEDEPTIVSFQVRQ